MSHFKSKLGMIKRSEEAMSKAETDQKLGAISKIRNRGGERGSTNAKVVKITEVKWGKEKIPKTRSAD